jgi:hypothetical protein
VGLFDQALAAHLGGALAEAQQRITVHQQQIAELNNAIAAGLSSFAGATHHQSMDVARAPGKARATEQGTTWALAASCLAL